ncbi:MAG: hypothetical protein II955_06320 [Clostridia bacterium]|nr:hypothetical protein [Clostridia bacterium]
MDREVRRFNTLDWVILTVLAAALALFGFLFWYRERSAPPTVPIVCVLRLQASETTPSIVVGDAVRNENGTVRFGDVVSVSVRPYRAFYLQNGAFVYGAADGLTETEIMVRMNAVRGVDYRVGDIRVCAGEIGNYRIGSSFAAGVLTVAVKEAVT